MPLLNVRWQVAGLLASAGKPSRPEHVAWIREQGFGAVVSLEAVPDAVAGSLAALGVLHLLIEIGDEEGFSAERVDPVLWEAFRGFLSWCLAAKMPVLVHCSAGIARSVRLCERYLWEEQYARK